jgi:diguanylate cyclase (GGDEF)-like protein
VKKQVEAEISEHQALTDALTGVMNRRALEGTLEREMSKASRYQRPLSLVLFDLDHFKTINDSYGHARGDVVLKTLTHLTELNLRLEDNLGRWGGEEFVLICSETTLEEAAEVAERLRLVIAEHPWDMPVSASFGVAQWQAGETLARFFERADQALYAAKQAGRNTVRTLVPTEQLGSVASNIALI